MRLPRLRFRSKTTAPTAGNVLRTPAREKPRKPSRTRTKTKGPSTLMGKGLERVGAQLRGAWHVVTGRVSLLQLIQENLLFTVFLTGIGLVYIWNSHQAERQARAATALEREIRELKTEYLTLNAQLSISRQQSRVEQLVDSLGLETPDRPPVKLEVADE